MSPVECPRQENAMTTVQLKTIALGMLLVLVAGACAFGQEVGDTVRTKQKVDLKVEDKAVDSVPAGEYLTVRRLNDKWLWVQTADGQRGWVLKEHVERVTNPPLTKPNPRSPAAPTKEDLTPWLSAIGVLSGQNIYLTNTFIGSISDGYVKEAYDAATVEQLMKEVVVMVKASRSSLESVKATNVADQDKATIDELIVILDLLSQEAEALARYVRSKDLDDLQAYEKAKDEVSPKVETLLRLK